MNMHCRGDRIWQQNQPQQNIHEHNSCPVTLPSLLHSLLLLTFLHNNAALLIVAALLSYFSEMTTHMNVKMEHFTPG